MNKRYINYASYNIWANNRLINNLSQQNEKLLSQELVASFPSIRATVLHIWFAEMGWLSRLNGNGWEVSTVTNFSANNEDLFKSWQITSKDLKKFVEKADLKKKIKFEHKEETFLIATSEIIQTVFNYGTFHRGQVVMMMRQLGILDISQTDYIEWVREKARAALS